jgi:hypothetical protein
MPRFSPREGRCRAVHAKTGCFFVDWRGSFPFVPEPFRAAEDAHWPLSEDDLPLAGLFGAGQGTLRRQ